MSLRIKNVISAQTKDRLLWCLAVQAQGPVGALPFTPRAVGIQATERSATLRPAPVLRSA